MAFSPTLIEADEFVILIASVHFDLVADQCLHKGVVLMKWGICIVLESSFLDVVEDPLEFIETYQMLVVGTVFTAAFMDVIILL